MTHAPDRPLSCLALGAQASEWAVEGAVEAVAPAASAAGARAQSAAPVGGGRPLALRWSPGEMGRLTLRQAPADWSGYTRLEFEIELREDAIVLFGFTLRDSSAEGPPEAGDGYENKEKLILVQGRNQIVVRLDDVWVNSGRRRLDLTRIAHFSLHATHRGEAPLNLQLNGVRLCTGHPAPGGDPGVRTTVDNRSVHMEWIGPQAAFDAPPEVAAAKAEAEAAYRALQRRVEAAKALGLDTRYDEIPLLVAEIGLEIRANLPVFAAPARRQALYASVADACRRGAERLGALLGKRPGAAYLPVPPYPRMRDVRISGGRFVAPDGRPLLGLSVHSTDTALVHEDFLNERLARFFLPSNHTSETFSAGGGSRYDIEDSPVYAAFHRNPETHRVGWSGWCGHLIKDVWSMGGKKENVVICLEHPEIKAAIRAYIREHAGEWLHNPDYLFNNMGYELMYICYCERSQVMFREWLMARHGDLEALNACWGTTHSAWDAIAAPPTRGSQPAPGVNRAAWYDWACFNQERFTRHLEWCKAQIRELAPEMAVTCGGISVMFGGNNGTAGIDEEQLIRRVDDVILNEAGHALIRTDLQVSLGEGEKPLADPEHAGDVWELLPHYLHGNQLLSYYYWGGLLGDEFPRLWNASLPHSWTKPLADVEEFLRTALDIRRLAPEIAAFTEAEAPIGLLYSKTNLIQIPPQLVGAASTPYLDELRRVHQAARFVDARALFISETQIEEGKLDRFKVVWMPACRHLPPAVVERIWAWVEAGGRLIVTPESLLADEYNRPRDFWGRLGVRITGITRPEWQSRAELEQGYDQSFSFAVRYERAVARTLTIPAGRLGEEALALQGEGVLWTLAAGGASGGRTTGGAAPGEAAEVDAPTGAAEVVGRLDGGDPGLLRIPVGRGEVWLAALPLTPQSATRLLDALLTRAGVDRPLRVRTPAGGPLWGVEARALRDDKGWLAYLSNTRPEPLDLRLETSFAISRITELRSLQPLDPARVRLGPRRTLILRLETP